MYRTNRNTKIAIISDSKKKNWPLGDYIHILSFLPNIKFKKLDWYSRNDTFKIIKEVKFINNYKNLNKFNENKYDHVINLFSNLKSTKKTFYINNLFDSKKNDKENTKNLLRRLAKVYNIRDYQIYFNKKKIIKSKYDLFICWNTNEEWKIKRYPYKKYLIIKKYLENKYNMKIHIQKKTDKLEKYIQNIKVSKIILSVMTLGIHFSMLFNKHLVALIGPNNYDDLKLYNKVTQILPNKRCKIHSKKLNIKYSKCSCMRNIDENKIIKTISKIYEKIS